MTALPQPILFPQVPTVEPSSIGSSTTLPISSETPTIVQLNQVLNQQEERLKEVESRIVTDVNAVQATNQGLLTANDDLLQFLEQTGLLIEENDKLKLQIDSLGKQVIQLQSQQQGSLEAQRRNAELTAQLEQEQQKNRNAQIEIQTLGNQIRNLQEESTQKLSQSEQNVNNLNQQVVQLQTNVSTFQQRSSELELQNSQFKKALDDANERFKQVETRFQQESSANQKNIQQLILERNNLVNDNTRKDQVIQQFQVMDAEVRQNIAKSIQLLMKSNTQLDKVLQIIQDPTQRNLVTLIRENLSSAFNAMHGTPSDYAEALRISKLRSANALPPKT